MKAYVVRQPAALAPFLKPASAVRLRGGTIGERLRGQLKKAGFAVVDVDALDTKTIEAGSLVVHDDVVLSDHLLRHFFAALPDREKNYKLEIDASHFALLTPAKTERQYRAVSLSYYGAPTEGAPVEWLRMRPTVIHSVAEGLPARMHALTDLRLFFVDFYAIDCAYWFDLHTAISLYCREYVANIVRFVRAFLPAFLVVKLLAWRWMAERTNSIGKNCRIHPTAVLEGCVIGDNVEIGPHTYLRSSIVCDGVVIREKSTAKIAFIGEGAFINGTDVLNAYVGAETSLVCPMFFNALFGERGFISGGSGFADFIMGAGQITVTIDGKSVPSNLSFLGSAVGDDCFLGANLVFAPGRTIPDGTRIFDHGLIKAVPHAPNGSFVLSGSTLLQIPDGFLGAGARKS